MRFNLIDSSIALNIAFLVNASILVLAGAVFFTNGFFEITEIQDAHGLLEPLMGSNLAPTLFAIALIASGQCSTITGTLSGQIVMEGYLHLRISPWIRRLLTRLLAVIPAFLVIWLRGEENTGELLIFSQVILSMQLGFAVIPLIHFVSDKKLMGKFAIRTWAKIASWIAASIIILLNAKVVSNGIQALFVEFSGNHLILYLTIFPVITAAVVLLIYILIQPLLPQQKYLSRGMHKEFLPLDFELKNDFKRVAVTLDFSAKDKETLSRALTTGGKDADYLLIHVVESAGALMMEKDISDLETNADYDILKRYAASLAENGYHVTHELGLGRPSKIIPQIVKRFDADLLVMGAHGHRGLKDVLLGETINAVRHSIQIPLLAVK